MTPEVLDIGWAPDLPSNRAMGIGIVGAGAIVNVGHLPAYRKAGFNVVGITDKNPEAARETAAKFDVPRVYEGIDDLLDDPAIEIVDIAVPATFQPDIAVKAARSGRHLLCQKPLAEELPDARRIVAASRDAGVQLAVNQQMRWDPGIRACKRMLEHGWLGEPTVATIDVSIMSDWSDWPWLVVSPRLDLLYHSIHYLDSMRFLFGMPDRLFCSAGRFPGQPEKAETRTTTMLEYDNSLTCLVRVNHWDWTWDQRAVFRFEGTEGLAHGTIGLLYNYPYGQPDTLRFTSKKLHKGHWFDVEIDDMWIPDAFVGPMASLMCAIESGGRPETPGDDNLDTLRIVHAAYMSTESHQTVVPAELASG